MAGHNRRANFAAFTEAAVLAALQTQRSGLTADEAAARLRRHGRNELPKAPGLSLVRQLFKQLFHFMALLLWLAGGLAFAVDMPELGWTTWTVVVVNALFSFWQEYQADKALAALSAMLPRKVKVYRGGRLEQAPAVEIVIGDILSLEAGDQVPADARLLVAEEVRVDLSLLTGESLPAACHAAPTAIDEQSSAWSANLLFAGTTVVAGKGLAVVYAVGKDTELGKVTKLTAGVAREKSSLEVQVRRIVRFVTTIALVMGAVAFALAAGWMNIDVRSSFIFCIGIIVANVPEGLLPTVSLSLAVGVRRMAQHNALVRKLSAVESLCATDVICTDKTGTITMNEVTVKHLWLPEGEIEVSGNGYEKQGELLNRPPELALQTELLLTVGVVCSDAEIRSVSASDALWDILGDPTEVALLVAAEKNGQAVSAVRGCFDQRQTKPFNPARKMMSVLCVNRASPLFATGAKVAFVKGAPPETLQQCRFVRCADGAVVMTEQHRTAILSANERLAGAGHRVLALAYKEGACDWETGEQELVFVGLAAMIDPPRPEVAAAVALCREAGIRVTMITGDYGLTAAAVGRQIGLVRDGVTVVTGAELDQLELEGFRDLLRQDRPLIFSRTTPEQKLKIVQAYQACGHVVAVTGDGVNDAPALKAADVGIAMGRGGTDVAREVAHIVLLDDHFATIVKAIEQGRAIYDNIRKFMTYILASNVPEIVPFIAMVFAKIPPALTILQILAIDVGTDMVPALALGAEVPEKGSLRRRPADYTGNLLDKSLFLRAYGFLGMIEAGLSMGAFAFVWGQYGFTLADVQAVTPQILSNEAELYVLEAYRHATTMALAAIIACQIGNVFVCRSERTPVWQLPLASNPLILIGIGTEIAIAAALLYLPFLAAVFFTHPLAWADAPVLLLCPIIVVALEELRRYVVRWLRW